MANYNYDESGSMAATFVIAILAFILVPLTFAPLFKRRKDTNGCRCEPCIKARAEAAKAEGQIFTAKCTRRNVLIALGWVAFGGLAYFVSNTQNGSKLYDPYEILGIAIGTGEKEIKSHYKKLSKLYHPDKVKATANQTVEDIQNFFVDLTKAYKSLTDETIRKNWEEFGDPDGRQQMSMGIALPTWIIEGKNNIWVLGVYGVLFGGGLPLLVGRWWFGSRQLTKDGVNAKSATAFWKSVTEQSTVADALGMLSKAYQFECIPTASDKAEFARIEKEIQASKHVQFFVAVQKSAEASNVGQQRAITLLFAHLLRLNINSSALKKEQRRVVLHTPLLLNSQLNVASSRSWLVPSLSIMRLNAYLTQALLPLQAPAAQLPGIKGDEVPFNKPISAVVKDLEDASDARAADARKAVEKWGNVDVLDASFKVIDERQVTPSAIVHLVLKLRLTSPLSPADSTPIPDDSAKANDKEDYKFLTTIKDVEDMPDLKPSFAHAPYWPSSRKPSWWIVLADPKTQKLAAVQPMRIYDIPHVSELPASRPYRTYKIRFQAPPSVGVNPWRVYIVSDSFVGAEVSTPITLTVEEPTAAEEVEDDISDPEEDSLAGQMALMKGGKVKRVDYAAESDDESSTDDEGGAANDSSDSDSD
ncbi:translocation protein sec63 [Cylindrobasidium torrendii FP15055 ss-10]|uniref:Translocation protein sec63 n=1 Tax=Cylindrobasidium torrendii FP15055 ss-10 TaxID=1314674 RepID=A0A0D7BNJ9_9AGAR|nr:translocation protein sec63 [Cylindrobasidium torrendii FP15055 ss-10]